MERDSLWGIGSCDYKEGPQPAIYELEAQESQWFTSQSESKCPRTGSANVWGQEKIDVPAQAKSKFPLLSPLFYLVAQWIRWCSPTLCITQSTELNVNLFKKYPLRHIISVLLATLTSLGRIKLTRKVNHHSDYYTFYCWWFQRNFKLYLPNISIKSYLLIPLYICYFEPPFSK